LSKKSFVLQALNIYDLDDVLQLSSILLEKRVPLKRVAGESFEFSLETSVDNMGSRSEKKTIKSDNIASLKLVDLDARKKEKEEQERKDFDSKLNSELLLWQREASKNPGDSIKKVDAAQGYKQNSQIYIVNQDTSEGKNKLKFASTRGVLVDKKQE